MPEKRRKPKPRPEPSDDIVPDDEASAHFVRTLVANGQAAPANADGSLPPGATHEIVGKTASGLPILRRRRFALF